MTLRAVRLSAARPPDFRGELGWRGEHDAAVTGDQVLFSIENNRPHGRFSVEENFRPIVEYTTVVFSKNVGTPVT